MGRVIIPVASIPMGNSKKWYQIGSTPSAPLAKGKLEISLTLRSLNESEVCTLNPHSSFSLDNRFERLDLKS